MISNCETNIIMDVLILDNIVSKVIRKKASIKEMLNLMSKFYSKGHMKISQKRVEQRIEQIYEYIKQKKIIESIPLIEQRSEKWYNIRNDLITASDFALAIGKGKFGSSKDFYRSKCGYETKDFDINCPPLKWGIRYEEVANMFYTKIMGVTVSEFGLIKHPEISFIGASPDGISDMGIMLEIKCPYKRKKTEEIPEQYYIQIQGQLEVCNLEECDYLECYIIEYNSRDEMKLDEQCKYKGVVYEYNDSKYEYGYLDDVDFEKKDYNCVYYYGIKDHFLRRVYRDRVMFSELINLLSDVWKNVIEYRKSKELYDEKISCVKKKTKVLKPVPRLFRDDIIDD